jgi:NitT/TauT family transport system substrate-binding protein
MPIVQSRRRFLTRLALGGAAGFGGMGAAGFGGAVQSRAAEPPPEVTTIRLTKLVPGICIAPEYALRELLASEGFEDVRYVVSTTANQSDQVARGELDFSMHFAGPTIVALDAAKPLTVLAGIHAGCFELFAHEGIRSIADLKGKSVGVQGLGSSQHVFLSVMAAYVGLDPAKDIRWISNPSVNPRELFAQGRIDAFLGFPPDPQDLRARRIGHVIVNSAVDRPWSQYFCCLAIANHDFVRRYPIATKRVLRGLLKATDLCAADPVRVARMMVDAGFTDRYDYALQALNEVPYGVWRDYDPEDTVRFYALRLQEVGMIKSTPQKIIAEGTDWRFLNELKRELKA